MSLPGIKLYPHGLQFTAGQGLGVAGFGVGLKTTVGVGFDLGVGTIGCDTIVTVGIGMLPVATF